MANLVDLGKVAVTFGGTWNSATSYERLTYVVYDEDGCGYVALKDNIGQTPGTDATVWQKATQAGRSIYDLAVKHGQFVGTEEEFVTRYTEAVAAAEAAASSASSARDAALVVIDTMNTLISSVESAEAERVADENARKQAERDRQSAEAARVDEFARSKAAVDAAAQNAETVASGIQTEELARQRAEAARQAAEAARETAEEERAEDFAVMRDTINQLNCGLIGLKVEDGEMILVQNAEAGTVTDASISEDGEVTIEFEI